MHGQNHIKLGTCFTITLWTGTQFKQLSSTMADGQ